MKEVVSSNPDYLLYVGNLEPRKNLISLIKALEDQRLSEIKLVIAGKPAWGYADILESMRNSNSVDYLGFVTDDERNYLLRNCGLFVFPSSYEGFGFPVLEALSASAPVLCSDRGALEEIAGPALRLDNIDASGIADGIATALKDRDELNRIRSAGPAWASRFTWEASAQAHLDVYREIA